MNITFVQAFEDETAAKTALGVMKTAGYKVFFIKDSDQAQLRAYPKTGNAKTLVLGELDEKKVFILLSTKDGVETD
jgi:hypothetical protein